MANRNDFVLRPMTEDDLPLVLEWRNSERVRGNMYTDHVISMEDHRVWFEGVRAEAVPRCMVFECRDKPLGVVNLSGIDKRNNKCHWGFYIGPADAPRGSGSVMAFLALEFIFETLRFRKLIGEALVFNQASINYHKRLGFREEGHFVEHVLKNGTYVDVVSFALFAHDWLHLREGMEEVCFGGEKESCAK